MDSWSGPTLGGLVESLEAAVAESPDTFLPLLSHFHRAMIAFQHALVSGFKRLYEPSQAGTNNKKKALAAAWTTLQPVFDEELAKCTDAYFEFDVIEINRRQGSVGFDFIL